VAVDAENDHYTQVEASLEFLQERLAAAAAAGATESEEYERSTAELHQQLEAQASKLVASQLRIATLKEELEQSKKRLEDEQDHEQQLLQRALQLEAEAEATGRTVEEMQQKQEEAAAATAEAAAAAERLQVKQQQPAVQSVKTSHFALALAETSASNAAAGKAAGIDLSQVLASADDDQQRPAALPLLGYDHATQQQLQKQHDDLADLEAEQLLQQLDAVLELSGAGGSRPSSRTASPTGSTGGSSSTRRPKTPDMALVRKHVEEMAKQYVKRLAVAEEELKAVHTVWQQAEAELAALRKQQHSSGGAPQRDQQQQQQQAATKQQLQEAAAEQDEPVTPQQGAQEGEGPFGRRSPTLSNWRTNWRTTDTPAVAADEVTAAVSPADDNWRTNWRTTDTRAAAADEVAAAGEVTAAASPADDSDDEDTDEYGCNDYYDDYDGSAASRSSWEEDQLQQLQHMQAIPPSPRGRAVYELVQMPPVFGQQTVSGSSHAAADAEHGMPGKMEVELQSPVFGGSSGPEPSGAVGLKGSLDEMNEQGFSGVPRALSPSGQQQGEQAGQQQSRGSWRTPVVGAVAVEALAVFAAAVAAGQQQQQQQQQQGVAQPDVAAVQQAARKGVRSSNPYVHVHVHCKSPDKPASA
jgi:hypothetical protein